MSAWSGVYFIPKDKAIGFDFVPWNHKRNDLEILIK